MTWSGCKLCNHEDTINPSVVNNTRTAIILYGFVDLSELKSVRDSELLRGVVKSGSCHLYNKSKNVNTKLNS